MINMNYIMLSKCLLTTLNVDCRLPNSTGHSPFSSYSENSPSEQSMSKGVPCTLKNKDDKLLAHHTTKAEQLCHWDKRRASNKLKSVNRWFQIKLQIYSEGITFQIWKNNSKTKSYICYCERNQRHFISSCIKKIANQCVKSEHKKSVCQLKE